MDSRGSKYFRDILYGSQFWCAVCRMFNRKVIDELERILNGETEKTHEETHASQLSVRDSYRKPPEYKSIVRYAAPIYSDDFGN
jgi:hypothetical protein